jgi:hypothetical protein
MYGNGGEKGKKEEKDDVTPFLHTFDPFPLFPSSFIRCLMSDAIARESSIAKGDLWLRYSTAAYDFCVKQLRT